MSASSPTLFVVAAGGQAVSNQKTESDRRLRSRVKVRLHNNVELREDTLAGTFGGFPVHLKYCLTSGLDDATIRVAVDHLSVEERARHTQFAFARDRRDFAAAHALLRRCLSDRGDRGPRQWTFTSDEFGKPSLVHEDAVRTGLSFNLAHTKGLVACVVARDCIVGIDVEAIDQNVDALALATRFFSPIETKALRQCDPNRRQEKFIEMWTLKEAFIKAIGTGLSYPLHEFSFTFDHSSPLQFDVTRLTAQTFWSFALFAPSARHRMAVAVALNSEQMPMLDVRAESLTGGGDGPPLAPLHVGTFRQAKAES